MWILWLLVTNGDGYNVNSVLSGYQWWLMQCELSVCWLPRLTDEMWTQCLLVTTGDGCSANLMVAGYQWWRMHCELSVCWLPMVTEAMWTGALLSVVTPDCNVKKQWVGCERYLHAIIGRLWTLFPLPHLCMYKVAERGGGSGRRCPIRPILLHYRNYHQRRQLAACALFIDCLTR